MRRTDCKFLGTPTGERKDCLPCGASRGAPVSLPVLECSVWGKCTAGQPVPGIKCCQQCNEYVSKNLAPETAQHQAVSSKPPLARQRQTASDFKKNGPRQANAEMAAGRLGLTPPTLWMVGGKIIVDGSGNVIQCPICPCSGFLTVNGCTDIDPASSIYKFTLTGITNGTCTDCSLWNSTIYMVLITVVPGTCAWSSGTLTPGICSGVGGRSVNLQTLPPYLWTLQFVSKSGPATFYSTTSFSLGGGTFTLSFTDSACSGWPASIDVTISPPP